MHPLALHRTPLLSLLNTAFERFQWSPASIATFLKVEPLLHRCSSGSAVQIELDSWLGCSWQVVVGEHCGFSVDFEVWKSFMSSDFMESFRMETFCFSGKQ